MLAFSSGSYWVRRGVRGLLKRLPLRNQCQSRKFAALQKTGGVLVIFFVKNISWSNSKTWILFRQTYYVWSFLLFKTQRGNYDVLRGKKVRNREKNFHLEVVTASKIYLFCKALMKTEFFSLWKERLIRWKCTGNLLTTNFTKIHSYCRWKLE